MNTPTIIALAVICWCALALLLAPPIGRGLKRAADAEILADPTDEDAVDCPDWCDAEHAAPGVSCYRTVSTLEISTAWLEVELSRSAHRPDGMEVHLAVFDPFTNAETVLPMSPGEAGTLAMVIAAAAGSRLSGAVGAALAGEVGWLAEALARAATLAGVAPCVDCGQLADVRPEFDRATGEQVARCAGCHGEALVGGPR